MAIDPSAVIHKMAVVDENATIGPNCDIGPFAVVGPDVVLGANVKLHSHAVVEGWTELGDETVVFPFASIGHMPQDLKFGGEKTQLIVGKRNRIREHVTMNPGTEGGGGITHVGDDGLFMMGVHVGHDCTVGNHVILANNASLGGHSVIEDHVVIGALAGVHQFTRVGRGAMIGGLAAVVSDVIPYGTVIGERAHLGGLNLVGLKRSGIDRELIDGLRHAYKSMFLSDKAVTEAIEDVRDAAADNHLIAEILDFIDAAGKRRITTPSDT
ncbi:MAG: acyl-ACP--UDP-N-acetylglucosamine O-acyltransferase [Pseudomonadota bacterium]